MQRDLVERARKGDHDAFAVLAGATIGRLYAAARLILRDPDRAEDAVQETLVRCWRDLPTLRDVDRFDAWLHRLFLNACYAELRSAKRQSIEVEIPRDPSPRGVRHPVGDRRPGPDRAWHPSPRSGAPHRHRASPLPGPAVAGRGRSHGHPPGDREVAAPPGHPVAARRARLRCTDTPRPARRVATHEPAGRPRPDARRVARRPVRGADFPHPRQGAGADAADAATAGLGQPRKVASHGCHHPTRLRASAARGLAPAHRAARRGPCRRRRHRGLAASHAERPDWGFARPSPIPRATRPSSPSPRGSARIGPDRRRYLHGPGGRDRTCAS